MPEQDAHRDFRARRGTSCSCLHAPRHGGAFADAAALTTKALRQVLREESDVEVIDALCGDRATSASASRPPIARLLCPKAQAPAVVSRRRAIFITAFAMLGELEGAYTLMTGSAIVRHYFRHHVDAARTEVPENQGCAFGHGLHIERVFKDFGLPQAIRTDNGVPFASPSSLFGLSRLSVWWLRLGIAIERIQPAHPEQNGRHERMHLTLEKEATKPAARNLLPAAGPIRSA